MAAGLGPTNWDDDDAVMRRALELAQRGLGSVEPNPPVGAVLVDRNRRLLGEGWHREFGGPHAEVHALRAAGDAARGADLFVTLEPCAHHGKTPPCVQAILDAGVRRVVLATRDPAPHSGDGAGQLRAAGVLVEEGICELAARELIAPFVSLHQRGRPWVHAKWAMSLDGRIATRTGASRWISCSSSREQVHLLRGRMDAILVGVGTVLADDPLLTARPAGSRTPLRIVIDPRLRTPVNCQLLRTLDQAPVLLVCAKGADPQLRRALEQRGAEILTIPARSDGALDLTELLAELGRRRMTHLLVEGGGRTLGNFFDQQVVDEVQVFIAPRILGGAGARAPVLGLGVESIPDGPQLVHPESGEPGMKVESIGDDVLLHCRVRRAVSDQQSEIGGELPG